MAKWRVYGRNTKKPNNDDKKGLWAIHWRQVVGRFADESGWDTDYMFHATRKWKFDWCHRVTRVAVEIDGGNRMAAVDEETGRAVAIGRHTQERDYKKLNAATADGWRVFRFTPDMLNRNPIECVSIVAGAVGVKLPRETEWNE